MADYVDELCENYSQGMKQRVVFASALVHDPKVLIVDEPLVGLDPRSARIVKDLFVAQARSGVAVLMSTHLLSIAEELADTIGIVDHGRMLAQGTLAELRERVQSHGPLEDLFLKLTGGVRPAGQRPSVAMPWPRRPRRMSRPTDAAEPTPADHRRRRPLAPSSGSAGGCSGTPSARSCRAPGSGWSMILICSADLLDRSCSACFFGGFQFIGIYVELPQRRSSSTCSACSSCRSW